MIGYSIGGQLSLRVTMALQSAGIPVSCLILLDAGAEVAPIPKPLGRRLREQLKGQVSLVSREGMATLVAKCLAMDSMRPRLYRLLRSRRKKLPFDFDRHLHARLRFISCSECTGHGGTQPLNRVIALHSNIFVPICRPCSI